MSVEPNAGPRTAEQMQAVYERQKARLEREAAEHASRVALIPKTTKYKYEFPLRKYSSDPRLLKYADTYSNLFNYMLRQQLISPETNEFDVIKNTLSKPYNLFKRYLLEVDPTIIDPSIQRGIYTVFTLLYDIAPGVHEGTPFPATDYPTESVFPPPYRIPGYILESGIDSAIRFIRYIMEHTKNKNIIGKTIQEAYSYIASETIRIAATEEAEGVPHQITWMRSILSNPELRAIDLDAENIAKWYRAKEVIGNYVLHDYDRNMRRFFSVTGPKWIDFLSIPLA
jgi:hypothetical protein